MVTVGITGGIGSGKSEVCRVLESLGARVFYSDSEAKRLMTDDAQVRREIVAAFGPSAYEADGALNRAYLASEVFGSAANRERINAIVHPRVYEAFDGFVRRARAEGAPLAVRESAVMPEGDGRLGLDLVVAVTAPADLRARRVQERDDASAEQVAARMAAQLTDEEFRERADRVLKNQGSLDELKAEARALYLELRDRRFPALGENIPRRGNALLRILGRSGLRAMGLRVTGSFPNLKKFVLIGAPHTSNWDFVAGMLMLFALGLRVNWLGKHTIFRWPFGGLMRWMGGIPVDRSRTEGLVDQVCAAMAGADRMIIGLAPEGTRMRVDRWKTGFHRIARGAEVPIVLGMLDFGHGELRVDSILYPTDDMEADLEKIQRRYRGVQGRNPDQFDLA